MNNRRKLLRTTGNTFPELEFGEMAYSDGLQALAIGRANGELAVFTGQLGDSIDLTGIEGDIDALEIDLTSVESSIGVINGSIVALDSRIDTLENATPQVSTIKTAVWRLTDWVANKEYVFDLGITFNTVFHIAPWFVFTKVYGGYAIGESINLSTQWIIYPPTMLNVDNRTGWLFIKNQYALFNKVLSSGQIGISKTEGYFEIRAIGI
jgi:hypothetical protein